MTYVLIFHASSSFSIIQHWLNVGAIFSEEQKDSFYDLAFKFAIHKINKDPRILPKSLLTYDIQYVDPEDPFRTNKKGDSFVCLYICQMISDCPFSSPPKKLKFVHNLKTVQ